MKCKECGATMKLTKSLSFGTGPLKLVFECSGRIIHAIVLDKHDEDCEELLLEPQPTGASRHPAAYLASIAKLSSR